MDQANKALIDAVSAGDANAVKSALSSADVNAMDMWQGTALHVAARAGNAEMALLLLEHGANIEAHDGADMTPLMVAVLEGHVEVVEVLLLQGAKVTNDLLMSLDMKVRSLEENAESGMVRPEAAVAWRTLFDKMVEIARSQKN